MNNNFTRRKFIITGGSLLLLSPLLEFCNDKSKSKSASSKPDKPKVKTKAVHTAFKRKHPVTPSMAKNRGWYKNKKNGKIHFFDARGFTPSLEYMKNSKEFDTFISHLEPWDAKQMTVEIFEKKVSKKKKDWITENAALVFTSNGNYAAASQIVRSRIEKRPVNVRMWDLLAVITLKSADEQLKAAQQTLITKYSIDKKLTARLTKFSSETWQSKIINRDYKWDNQKI